MATKTTKTTTRADDQVHAAQLEKASKRARLLADANLRIGWMRSGERWTRLALVYAEMAEELGGTR